MARPSQVSHDTYRQFRRSHGPSICLLANNLLVTFTYFNRLGTSARPRPATKQQYPGSNTWARYGEVSATHPECSPLHTAADFFTWDLSLNSRSACLRAKAHHRPDLLVHHPEVHRGPEGDAPHGGDLGHQRQHGRQHGGHHHDGQLPEGVQEPNFLGAVDPPEKSLTLCWLQGNMRRIRKVKV